jgi:hypothetical protein
MCITPFQKKNISLSLPFVVTDHLCAPGLAGGGVRPSTFPQLCVGAPGPIHFSYVRAHAALDHR